MSGAASAQIIFYAAFAQIMPFATSQSLLRFETNVRSATILGFCGAGGIGFLMYDKINGYAYREVCTMMILIIVTVAIIDQACGKLMKACICETSLDFLLLFIPPIHSVDPFCRVRCSSNLHIAVRVAVCIAICQITWL